MRVGEDEDDAVSDAALVTVLDEVEVGLVVCAGRVRVLRRERDAELDLEAAPSEVYGANGESGFVCNLLGAAKPVPEFKKLIIGDLHSVPICCADRLISELGIVV